MIQKFILPRFDSLIWYIALIMLMFYIKTNIEGHIIFTARPNINLLFLNIGALMSNLSILITKYNLFQNGITGYHHDYFLWCCINGFYNKTARIFKNKKLIRYIYEHDQ